VDPRCVGQTSSAECIEIWNLVFIQFSANPDGTFSPLPAKHVDTGMGFERVTSIIQGTRNFTDFANAKISNYETDIFRPIFDKIEELSGRKYGSTLPDLSQLSSLNAQQAADIAFRVIADHIRTLSFAIADGIQPSNTDRNYVLRRILRRAVRYGRTLGFAAILLQACGRSCSHNGRCFSRDSGKTEARRGRAKEGRGGVQ
jgi:alanyl-tRNA synthetase